MKHEAKVMKESVPKGGDGGAPALSMGKDSVVFGDDDVRAVVGMLEKRFLRTSSSSSTPSSPDRQSDPR